LNAVGKMKTQSLLAGAAIALAISFAASQASAADTVLLQLTDATFTESYDLAFTAVDATTTISFAGYNVPSFEDATDNGLYLNDAGPNLLGAVWSFAAAPTGSDSFTFDDGTAVPALAFGSVDVGSYDVYSQSIATTAGSSYNLHFNYVGEDTPAGFIVTTSGSTGAVPEPATWALMISGFMGAGVALRRRRAVAAAA
jgi:PEP-CTERM motif